MYNVLKLVSFRRREERIFQLSEHNLLGGTIINFMPNETTTNTVMGEPFIAKINRALLNTASEHHIGIGRINKMLVNMHS